MDFIGGVLYAAFWTIVIMAALMVFGWREIAAWAVLLAVAVALWLVGRLIVAKCAGCWRCMIARICVVGGVSGLGIRHLGGVNR